MSLLAFLPRLTRQKLSPCGVSAPQLQAIELRRWRAMIHLPVFLAVLLPLSLQAYVVSGTYTGNGTSQTVSLGFQPSVVIVKDGTSGITTPAATPMQIRTSTMSLTKDMGQSTASSTTGTDRITAFTATGFTVGASLHVNNNGRTFHYLALSTTPGEIVVGTYTGNGVDNRNITGLGFQPDMVMTMYEGTANAVFRTVDMPTDKCLPWLDGPVLNGLQSFVADGFQVGTDASVNTNGTGYHYIACKHVTGKFITGTYIGNNLDRNITGLGFQPEAVFIRLMKDAAPQPTGGVKFGSTGTGNSTLLTTATNSTTNVITSLLADGFGLSGASNRVNWDTYPNYYFAFEREEAGSVVVPTVASPTSTAVTSNSATLGGSITATGGANATARGVVYALTSQNPNPEIGGANVTVLTESGSFSTGAFTRNATSLAASSGYSYKAYATNSAGTSYSSVGTFTTTAATATIIFNASTGISGSVVTDGQGGSNDVSNIALQFSAKGADGTTDLPMTYEPNIYPGANGIAGGYNSSSIQSVFKIKSSSTATNFTMSSIFIVDYGGVAGDLLRIEAFDDGVSAGFITYQVSGAPWYATVDLAGLGGTKFVDIDEVRITGNGGVNMYIAVNNVTISGVTTSASTTTVSSLVRANATPSNLNTVNWTLTFGSAVTGVTASNFTLGGTSTGAAVGTPSTANAGLSWTVPVTTGTDGTLLLRLDNDAGISSDVTTTLPFVGETYTVDKTAPDTSITANPALLTTSTSASFSFTGSDAGSGVASYQVKLDTASFATGTSPTAYTSLADGSHTFQVRAVDAAGNVDASPASYTWNSSAPITPEPVPTTLGDVVSAGSAPGEDGSTNIGDFGVLRRGGFLAENGHLAFPGTLEIGTGSPAVTLASSSGLWKTAGGNLFLLARSGTTVPDVAAAQFSTLPEVPGISAGGHVSFLGTLNIGTGGVTADNDTGLWSELGGTGLNLLLREDDDVPGLAGVKVAKFASGAYATATTGASTGQAAFSVTYKGSSTKTALLRASISGAVTTISVIATEGEDAPGTAVDFANLAGSYSDPGRMDSTGNFVFSAITTPGNKEGLWYQTVAGTTTKVIFSGETAPGTSGATFLKVYRPSIGSGGIIAFRASLNANGDNSTSTRNDGIWRGDAANPASLTCILRRGDDSSVVSNLPVGTRVGNPWGGWLTPSNRGAWKAWLDTNGDFTSAAPTDRHAIYTDLSGAMQLAVTVNDAAPGTAGATFSGFDLPVVGGDNQYAFIGNLAGGDTVPENNQGLWKSAPNGGALTLALRKGDAVATSEGSKTVSKIDLPGSLQTDRRWEQPVMDNTGRMVVYITFTDGSTSQIIVP
ncbi:beta strand repeat-containing protein [Prosthecobacter dejongeii]|uniref:Ig-like domain (Group 3) n=1 Tax=Prosthecobacter dejongeii TaxID=48465 RepID=A0A7W8DPN5_9BACT|nr:choice-of-anchor tandem repeat NxxGxxAF-containing protein [Prosthecobacter dejongeii]MBB5037502.1 hypothetical protein [Prosthecobacter dejongeii]